MNGRERDDRPVAVGVDGSSDALRATRWAAREAARRRVRLEVFHALDLPDGFTRVSPSDALMAGLREAGAEIVRTATKVARQTAGIQVVPRLELGSATTALYAASRTARLLVLGASGRDRVFAAATLGSIPVKMAAHAECPVVIVRGGETEQRGERDAVVVGLDGGPLSESALAVAFEEAALLGVPLIAAHAWREGEARVVFDEAREYFDWQQVEDVAERTLTECLAGWPEKFPEVTVERAPIRDRAVSALLRLSERARLVAVGSRGRGGFSGLLLGSTSQALMHHAACPVLIARPAPANEQPGRVG